MGYWEERQENMYKVGEMQVNQYFTRLEKAFNQTRRELQKTIDAFYFRYAEENGLSFAAAQKKLDAEELGELQDFIDLAMKNIGKYNQQVNNMSIKARITRYQALEAQVDAILRQLYAIDYEAEAEQTMQEVYEDTYYRTWYNADQYHGFHAEFAQVSPTVVEKLLEYPFNGVAFSSRLWKQKDHLQAQLMEVVTTMLIQGKHPSTLTKEFAKKMNSKKFDAYRLLHTESSFLMSEAIHAGYKEDGVTKYEILATLDSKTCNICGKLDNRVYEVGKEVVGVNMPPFHPLCRCTTVPHYDDTPTEGMTRVARNPETGKIYEVPVDMSWKEWKKRFMDGEGDNLDEKLAASLRSDEKFQNRAAQRRGEWKKRHASFDKENAKLEINTIRSQMEDLQKQISESSEKEKILEKKVYFDGIGSDEDMAKLKALVDSRKKSQEGLDALKEKLLAKQETYKTEAENRIAKAGIVEEIKLSRKMTPETVDALEATLKRIKDKYGIMPKGIVYNPIKVPDATASYNWLDDKIYISNRFYDIEKYAETVKASEASLKEYRKKSKNIDIQKERLKNAEKILSDKSIKGYEREKAILAKAEAEIELNIQRMAVREDLMDVLTHEYGHFIHRHAETDYIQKSKVFQAKELGGKITNGDWKYDINTRYSAKAKIDAAKISKYATENPYETFAEGFLAMDKGEKIPDNIVKVINEAKIKAGVKNVAKETGSGIMELPQDERSSLYQYKSFESYPINEALRNAKDMSVLPPAQQQFVKRLDSALSKMPKYKGDLIRTVNFSDWPDCDKRINDFAKEFIPGKNIQIRQYWSTSKREGYDDEASIKIYIQNAQNGRDVSSVGLDEAEVLYERNCMFEVISKMNRKGIWYILLKEV